MGNNTRKFINNTIKDTSSFIYKVLDGLRLNNISNIYDSEYFTKRLEGTWRSDIKSIVSILFDRYKPGSVIDFGCASGAYLYEFKKLGVKKIFGVDGSKAAIDNAIISEIYLHDLRDSFKPPHQFDLVICFEVAEHIHEKYSSNLINSLVESCKNNSFLVFTAASKGQRGKHHVNLKNNEWWIKEFENKNMLFIKEDTKNLAVKFKKELKLLKHMPDNLMIFKRCGG